MFCIVVFVCVVVFDFLCIFIYVFFTLSVGCWWVGGRWVVLEMIWHIVFSLGGVYYCEAGREFLAIAPRSVNCLRPLYKNERESRETAPPGGFIIAKQKRRFLR